MPDHDPSSSAAAQQSKKKRAHDNDPSVPPDAGQKPIQLQRRRVWRACENCRRKKIKCDGTEPVCAQCSTSSAQCTWLQTKDRAALSRHYVQELEARLMHMEEVFKQVAPIVEVIEKSPNGGQAPIQTVVDALKRRNEASPHRPQPAINRARRDRPASEQSASSSMPKSPSVSSSREEEDMSEAFGQLALDEHGHLRWIGGSSTMSLIQSFRALTTSPLTRMSPMEDDPHSPMPSANKLYFPASIYFGKLTVLPGPEDVEYPERDLADKLVDAYFKRLHFLLPAVDKSTFLVAYNNLMNMKHDVNIVRAQTPFIALVFAVFACAARIVDDPRLDAHSSDGGVGMVFYERALVLHYISHASVQIAQVQCIVLLSSFLCSVNCLPQAWLLVGEAVRMAQDLGLHRYSRHITITPVEKQIRRKVFWSVYALDRMLAMALGRPLGIDDNDCDAEYPFEIDDDDLQEFFTGAQMSQKTQPSLMLGFIALCDLYRIGGRVCRQIYGIDSFREHLEPEKVKELTEQATHLDNELLEWCNQLPNTFKSAPTNEAQVTMGAVLCSHYYSILTTLHRNFLPLRQSQFTGIASSLKAVHTARSCIRLAPSVKNVVPSSHHLAFFIQHLFSSAVIILLYAMHISDKSAAQTAMAEAESCIGVMSGWEGVWPGARKCRELLLDLASKARDAMNPEAGAQGGQRTSPFSGVASPTSPTRATRPAKIIKGKLSRGKSRDAREHERRRSLSVQRSRSVAPTASGLARRALSQRRAYDDVEQLNPAMLSSSVPGRSFHQPFGPAGAQDPQPSFSTGSEEEHDRMGRDRHVRQVSFATPSAILEGVAYNGNHADGNLDFMNETDQIMNWQTDVYDENEMFRNLSQDSEGLGGAGPSGSAGSGTQSFQPNPLAQGMMDNNLLAYGDTLNSLLGYNQPPPPGQDDTPPQSSFDALGLPFAGLDFIRNYTNGGGYEMGQDPTWKGFDGGEFRYDPDLPFSLENGFEEIMDGRNRSS